MVLTVPPILAGIWFPQTEVSTACSLGVMANQLGAGIGFLVPPLFSENLQLLFGLGAIVTSVQAVLMVLFFKDLPEFPPSLAQFEILKQETTEASLTDSFQLHFQSILKMLKKKSVLLLVISYGLNTGTYYVVGTLLGRYITKFDFAIGSEGNVGLTLILTGLFGCTLAGYWLDKYKTYKKTTVFMYFCSFMSMAFYTVTPYIYFTDALLFYISGGLLGLFITGYLPVLKMK